MEAIYFDEELIIWKKKLGLTSYKDLILKEALDVIELNKNTHNYDAYNHKQTFLYNINDDKTKGFLDKILDLGIERCKNIVEKKYNTIFCSSWVNLVRANEPIQPQFNNKEEIVYHNHKKLAEMSNNFKPTFTFVYYIQMPDILENKDGHLFFKSKNEKEYSILPNEDELIIMKGDVPHAPNKALKSNLDRIVLAANVGFEFVKKDKSFV